MKILIMSPGKNTGNTLSTAIIGSVLATTQKTDVCLTYTTTDRRRLCDYLGVEPSDDVTTNIRQISNLINANAVSPKDCKDYLLKVRENLYLLDTTSTEMLPEDRLSLMHSIFSFDLAPIMICDVSSSNNVLDNSLTKSLIEEADIIIFSVTPDSKSIGFLKDWVDSGKLPMNKEYALLVNAYDERIVSVRDIAKAANFKLKNTLKIHYNPYLRAAASNGEVLNIVYKALTKDPMVIELRNDMKEICQYIVYFSKGRLKWED